MTIWCMRIACWMPKATNTHTQVVEYLLLFHSNNGCTHSPQCDVIRTLPLFFIVMLRTVSTGLGGALLCMYARGSFPTHISEAL
jgi:hypothetical protein